MAQTCSRRFLMAVRHALDSKLLQLSGIIIFWYGASTCSSTNAVRVVKACESTESMPPLIFVAAASFANLVALLAMNASFCEIDARSAQVIKALEPAFTILISAVAFPKLPSLSKVGAALPICFGVGLSTAPSSLNVAGMTLGLVAASGMPVRNLLLKEVES